MAKSKKSKKSHNPETEAAKQSNRMVGAVIRSHEDYIAILNAVRKDTEKIIIVQIDGFVEDDPIVNTAREMMILEKKEIVDTWDGTYAPRRKAVKYTYFKKREFFDYLSKFEAFYIIESTDPWRPRDTDFDSNDDLAFVDHKGETIFFTTTHEGRAIINEKYLDQLTIKHYCYW